MNVSYDDQIKELQKQTERLKKKLDDTENTLIAIFEREERRNKKMDGQTDILDKDSTVLPTIKEEDLISDNNYNEDRINSQCIIDECSDLGENLIAITEDDPDNCIPYFVCDRHYHELMIGYYSKQKKNNNNALTIISQTH